MAFKNIEATLDEQGVLHLDRMPNVNHGENISVGIIIEVAQEFRDKQPQGVSYHLEFKTPNNQKYVTLPIPLIDGKLTCEIKNSVLSSVGEAQVQVVGLQADTDYIFKSQVATFFVEQSINAVQEEFFSNDFLAQATTILAEISAFQQKMQQIVDEVQSKLDKGEFVGPQGERGEKGDKGDPPQLSIIMGDLYADYN